MYGQANSITSTQRSPQETLKSQNRRICGCAVFGDIGCQAAENVVTVYDFHVAKSYISYYSDFPSSTVARAKWVVCPTCIGIKNSPVTETYIPALVRLTTVCTSMSSGPASIFYEGFILMQFNQINFQSAKSLTYLGRSSIIRFMDGDLLVTQ